MNKNSILILLIYLLLFSITACSEGDTYLSKQNEEAKVYYDKARAEYKDGRYKKAISYLNKALKLEPNNSKMYTKRGDCYRKIRKASKAVNDYDLAIKYNKSNARAYYHRGTMKIILGKKDDGCLDVKKAKSLAYLPANNYYNEHCQ